MTLSQSWVDETGAATSLIWSAPMGSGCIWSAPMDSGCIWSASMGSGCPLRHTRKGGTVQTEFRGAEDLK